MMLNSAQLKLNAISRQTMPPSGKVKYGSVLPPDACNAFRRKAKRLRISQSDLLEILAYILDEPNVDESIEQYLKRNLPQP